MKTIFTYISIVLFLAGTGVLPLNAHYCQGKLALFTIDLPKIESKASCCSTTSICDISQESPADDCCEDVPLSVQQDIEQLISHESIQDLETPAINALAFVSQWSKHHADGESSAKRFDPPDDPLGGRSLRIRLSSLVLYA